MSNHHPTSFTHSDPRWRVALGLPTEFVTPEMVTAGDIVYTRRPKGYQRFAALVGDTWRHVGIVATIAGFPWLIDMGQGGYGARPLTTVLGAYDTIAIQRLSPCGEYCDHSLVNNVALQMNYPKSFFTPFEMGIVGMNSLLRLRMFHKHKGAHETARRLRTYLTRRNIHQHRALCTTPVASALTVLCEAHSIALDISGEKGPVADAHRGSPDDVIFAAPDDLWRALQTTTSPYWVKKNGKQKAVDIDLTTIEQEEVAA